MERLFIVFVNLENKDNPFIGHLVHIISAHCMGCLWLFKGDENDQVEGSERKVFYSLATEQAAIDLDDGKK